MRSTRCSDPHAAAIRAAPSATFRKRHEAETAAALDVRNHAPTTEAQILKIDGRRYCPPPPWRPVGDPIARIVAGLMVVTGGEHDIP